MANRSLVHYKNSFALFSTIVFMFVLFLLTHSIVQSDIFQSNLNKLKYMNLQATIHFDYVVNFINSSEKPEIDRLYLNDERFKLTLQVKEIERKSYYYVTIEAVDENIPVRLSEQIIK